MSRSRGEAAAQGVPILGSDELVDEIGSEGEMDAVAPKASELAECVGEVGSADAGRTEEDDIGALTEEARSSKLGRGKLT